jgi:hypothetical protein
MTLHTVLQLFASGWMTVVFNTECTQNTRTGVFQDNNREYGTDQNDIKYLTLHAKRPDIPTIIIYFWTAFPVLDIGRSRIHASCGVIFL